MSLMNELDSGRVVFFCGAGISAGPASGLPDYTGLMKKVYETSHLEPDSVECEALDLEDNNLENLEKVQPNFDKAFGLLERPERLGSERLRRSIIDCLSIEPTGALPVHDALLTLSRSEKGVRLITTNFDNRFIEAGLNENLVDASPKLPVPKTHRWSSLVHLHGRIKPQDDGLDLVITAADFGRAYLTEAWAARFITELFREFIVVFVGYSVSDPVMAYMVDALAAESKRGARFMTTYAFAAYEGAGMNIHKVQDEWRAKNIEPIPYDKKDRHRLLGETLVAWAEIRKDPYQARSWIALNEMSKMPAGPDDPAVERVTWALQDSVAAENLANAPAVTDESDYLTFEKWLDILDRKGVLSCTASYTSSNVLTQDSTSGYLVDNGDRLWRPNDLDPARSFLAQWLARHIHIPQLLAWVLRKGGQMHPELRMRVQRSLADSKMDIPEKLRHYWTVLLDNLPVNLWRHVWTTDQYNLSVSDERRFIEDQVILSITPKLEVRSGPSREMDILRYFDDKPRPLSSLEACAHLKLTVGHRDTREQFRYILYDFNVLARNAERLTGYLEQALSLAVFDDDVYKDSTLYRSSIVSSNQNDEHDDWTCLIDLARDSYLSLAKTNRFRADYLLNHWVLSKQPIFKRLALHALTDNPKSDIRLARKLLVNGRWPGMWNEELRKEVLRLLRLAGSRLPRDLRVSIVKLIHAGPNSKQYYENIQKEKALRLIRLQASGAKLDKKSSALIADENIDTEGELNERDEFRIWSSEATWIAQEDFTPENLLNCSVAEISTALLDSKMSSDVFHGLALQKPVKAASALRRLAIDGEWPKKHWNRFLWSLTQLKQRETLRVRLLIYVSQVIKSAPNNFFTKGGSSIAGFVKLLAEEWDIDRESDIRSLWNKVWNGIEKFNIKEIEVDDVLDKALNNTAGKLAEAALLRLQKHNPKTDERIPKPVRQYFNTIFTDQNGHLGRVMLAMRLYYLFVIDRQWVKEQMIPLFDPQYSEEAAILWSGYAHSPTVSPDLLQTFKEPFLQVLKDVKQIGRRKRHLIGLYITICLEAPDGLTNQEILDVIKSMSEESLVSVLNSLRNRFKGDATERSQVWNEKVYPWLDRYWPSTGTQNTTGTSKAILGILCECGDAFPHAVDWSLPYLKPVTGNGLYLLKETDYIYQHSESTLQLLDKVISSNGLMPQARHTLKSILDKLKEVNPGLVADTVFQKLYKIAT